MLCWCDFINLSRSKRYGLVQIFQEECNHQISPFFCLPIFIFDTETKEAECCSRGNVWIYRTAKESCVYVCFKTNDISAGKEAFRDVWVGGHGEWLTLISFPSPTHLYYTIAHRSTFANELQGLEHSSRLVTKLLTVLITVVKPCATTMNWTAGAL